MTAGSGRVRLGELSFRELHQRVALVIRDPPVPAASKATLMAPVMSPEASGEIAMVGTGPDSASAILLDSSSFPLPLLVAHR